MRDSLIFNLFQPSPTPTVGVFEQQRAKPGTFRVALNVHLEEGGKVEMGNVADGGVGESLLTFGG